MPRVFPASGESRSMRAAMRSRLSVAMEKSSGMPSAPDVQRAGAEDAVRLAIGLQFRVVVRGTLRLQQADRGREALLLVGRHERRVVPLLVEQCFELPREQHGGVARLAPESRGRGGGTRFQILHEIGEGLAAR